jgi:hypothetical protein
MIMMKVLIEFSVDVAQMCVYAEKLVWIKWCVEATHFYQLCTQHIRAYFSCQCSLSSFEFPNIGFAFPLYFTVYSCLDNLPNKYGKCICILAFHFVTVEFRFMTVKLHSVTIEYYFIVVKFHFEIPFIRMTNFCSYNNDI